MRALKKDIGETSEPLNVGENMNVLASIKITPRLTLSGLDGSAPE